MSEQTPVSWLVIERGWRVIGSDGSELGRVDDIAGDTGKDIFSGIVVSEGLLKGRRFVPSERVAKIVEGEVHVAGQDLEEYESPAPQEQVLAPDPER